MATVFPQAQAFAEFAASPQATATPLQAHISGGHAQLVRYAESTEKALGQLDYYDPLIPVTFPWPNLQAGGVIDSGYTKLWMQNALLQYFMGASSSGITISKVANYNNRVRAASVSFAANGATYPRTTTLLRDVQVGDVAKVRAVNGDGDAVTLWTFVQSVIGDVLPTTVSETAADAANVTTQSASASVVKTAGPDNCVVVDVEGGAYNGQAAGNINETYTVLVTNGSTAGDFSTASLRVTSGSGNDDVASVTPNVSGLTVIGTRGLTVTFVVDSGAGCSESATTGSVSAVDLIVGQKWVVTVAQAFAEPTSTSAGTYTGSADTTYIVTVVRGGGFGADVLAAQPQIKCTTTNGVDISGPTNVAHAATAVAVGTGGVTISFTGANGLCGGDRYYITVTTAGVGAMKTLAFGQNMDTTIADDASVDVTLYIKNPALQISADRVGFAPTLNWTQDPVNGITTNSGIIAYDPSWMSAGVAVPLPVVAESTKGYGMLYVEYRAWLQTFVGDVFDLNTSTTVSAQAAVANISGALHPDNPLKWGVYWAALNSNDVTIKYSGVADPSQDSAWADVLQSLLGRNDVYGLVPLTTTPSVLALFLAHVLQQSSPDVGLWRVLWTSLSDVPEIPIVSAGSTVPGYTAATTTDAGPCLAVIEDDPNTAGTQYTLVRCTSANGNFLVNGILPGDVLRSDFSDDGFGNVTYSEYIVASVVSEDELLLQAGPSAPVSVAATVEVWRTLTKTQEAAAIGVNASAYASERVRAVWPDTVDITGTIVPGYFACAALAGLSSGILPQRSLTNLAIAGPDATPRTSRFNSGQLLSMRESGVLLVATDPVSGSLYTVQGVTTGSYADINAREEMVTRNLDSLQYQYTEIFAPFQGVSNITPAIQERLTLLIDNLTSILTTGSNGLLGPQCLAATVTTFAQHATLLDRYVLNMSVTLPTPFNDASISLVVL